MMQIFHDPLITAIHRHHQQGDGFKQSAAQSLEHRDRIARVLRDQGIETRPLGGGNMSRQPFWSDRYGSEVFPVADRIHTTGFQLPNHPGLSPDDIHHICDVALSVGAD